MANARAVYKEGCTKGNTTKQPDKEGTGYTATHTREQNTRESHQHKVPAVTNTEEQQQTQLQTGNRPEVNTKHRDEIHAKHHRKTGKHWESWNNKQNQNTDRNKIGGIPN